MNELLTAALEARDVTKLVEFPQFLMNAFEKEVTTWILTYNRTYGEPPLLERLRRQFPHFIPLASTPPLPLGDVYQLTITRKRKDFAISRLSDIVASMRDLDDVPTSEISTMLVQLNSSDGDLSKYSTFSRDLYFRTGSMKLGLPIIDRAIGGLANGDYGLISGRLGTGKSTLQQWFTFKWWMEGKRILYISKEMLAVDVFARVDGMVGKFNPLSIRTTAKSELEPALKIVSKIAAAHKGEIIIPSRQVTTVSQIGSIAQYLDIDVIVVDGVYLLQPDDHRTAKWESVAAVSNALKQTAMDLQKPIFASTQIKRTGNKEEYDPEDLAYSDALGQDADFLIAIRQSKSVKNRLELQLIKNRFGPPSACVVYVDHDTMTITDESVEGSVGTFEEDDDV